MKARIVKKYRMYYGEVYGEWTGLLGKSVGWREVTSPCLTKWGAKLELKRWKEKNCPTEFEI